MSVTDGPGDFKSLVPVGQIEQVPTRDVGYIQLEGEGTMEGLAKRLSSQKRGQNKQANKETKNMAHQQECKFSYSTDEDTRNIPHICI